MMRPKLALLLIILLAAYIASTQQQITGTNQPAAQQTISPQVSFVSVVSTMLEQANRNLYSPYSMAQEVKFTEGEQFFPNAFINVTQRETEFDSSLKWTGHLGTGIFGEHLKIAMDFSERVFVCCGAFSCKVSIGLVSKICP
ncbi:hypothetical protein HY546_02585 [archaeon]|nr:hypothetical protein [archaeon]